MTHMWTTWLAASGVWAAMLVASPVHAQKSCAMTITVSSDAASTTGLVVRRDGAEVPSSSLGKSGAVDCGEHTIEATAPGMQPFVQKVNAQDGATLSVSIPALLAQAQPTPEANAAASAPSTQEGTSPVRIAGYVALGVSVVVMGIGAYFGAKALSKNDDSNNTGCSSVTDKCTTQASIDERNDARSAGNVSTALFVTGGILLAAGIVMVAIGKPSEPDTKPKASLRVAPVAGGAAFALTGRF